MHYDYDKERSLEEIIKETQSRIKKQEKFMKGVALNFIIKPLYITTSRIVYKEAKTAGLENIEELKRISREKPTIIAYNHMFDFDVVEIIYQLLKRKVYTANVAKNEFFESGSTFKNILKWVMENSGSFPVFLEYEKDEKGLLKKGKAKLDRKKLNNFFKQFTAYLELKKPVTIAINGSITRDKTFPKPEEGISYIIQTYLKENKKISELAIMPVGVAFIGDLKEYNEILLNREKYKNIITRNYLALKKLIKKISIYLSFGKPFNFEINELEFNNLPLMHQRKIITETIYNKIKEEIKKSWSEFKIEEKYKISLEEYFKE